MQLQGKELIPSDMPCSILLADNHKVGQMLDKTTKQYKIAITLVVRLGSLLACFLFLTQNFSEFITCIGK